MGGYAGKILYIDLTEKRIAPIDTADYEEWVGGHGIGSALFFDLVKDKTIDGFHPDNLVTVTSSPISGTLVPCGAGRTEVQGIGLQSHPIGWFTRSNFGGRVSPMLKYAGWDAIAVQGASDEPVWIDIRDGDVQIRPCSELGLWGMDTRECQEAIWDFVAGGEPYGGWNRPGPGEGQSTQRPAVLAIGPAGENRCRFACLMHDAGNSSGQGGFGGVFGSKKLKAISVIGTGRVLPGDPKALFEARLWHKENYAFRYDDLLQDRGIVQLNPQNMTYPPSPIVFWGRLRLGSTGFGGRPPMGRPQACVGCYAGCRGRYEKAIGNEAHCLCTEFYGEGRTVEIQRQATDLVNRYGLNALEMTKGLAYLKQLNKLGVLGPGKAIDCPFDWDDLGSLEFAEQLVKAVAHRNDGLGNAHSFGDTIAEGFVRAAEKWGRLESDSKHGEWFQFPYWGYPEHGYDARGELEWGYGSILGDRDINEHEFNNLMWNPSLSLAVGVPIPGSLDAPAEEAVTIYTDKMEPYDGAPEDRKRMLDYSDENMYTVHIARLVSWHRHYARFWKQSVLFCDMRWPDWINHYAPDKIGSATIAEPRFLSAVLGREFTFLEGMTLGRRIWNLDHAIWTLQGRHRDMVQFANYIYEEPFEHGERLPNFHLPGIKDGKWQYVNVVGRHIDKTKFEHFKTLFYQQEGWDTETGYPTRATLEALDLGHVADELEAADRLR